MRVTKKTEARIKSEIPKFQKVLAIAKDRDLNESDTVSIITDMLAEIFGYDKYLEVTSELAIRGTFCDLAIKLGDKFQYLIECKAIGTELKEQHIRQAVNYGMNKGIQWVALTNGLDWIVYRLRFEQPVTWDIVAQFNMATVSVKNDRDMERLIALTKEGVERGCREELYEKIQCVNRFMCAALLQSEVIISALRKEFKKLADGISIEHEEILTLLRDGVLRRDLLEGEEAEASMNRISKHFKQASKKGTPRKPVAEIKPEAPKPQMSMSEQLLAEAAASVPDTSNLTQESTQTANKINLERKPLD